MSKIRIKNVGPIKEGYLDGDGFIDIKKVTLFIGNQGSGKSTLAKLISSFTWLEKSINRGDQFKGNGKDIIDLVAWQRLASYLVSEKTEIEYIGDRYKITYKPTNEAPWPIVEKIENGNYIVPKVMYVPAERNFLSTIEGAFDFSTLPGPLKSFAEELKRAQFELNGVELDLPFENIAYQYDVSNNTSYVIGSDYKINLLDAASGLHSSIPLFLVSRNLGMKTEFENVPEAAVISANHAVRRDREISNLVMNKSLTSEEKDKQIEEIFAKYHSKCFINIVEEPEQNLFPISQRAMLNRLLEFNNLVLGNKLIMTTHSPYLINFLTLAVKAYSVYHANEAKNEKVFDIVPEVSLLDPEDLVIYQLDEKNGTITKLDNYYGIPSDKNYLNQSIAEGNELFDALLEIEEDNED